MNKAVSLRQQSPLAVAAVVCLFSLSRILSA
jgi:hypothetical protein